MIRLETVPGAKGLTEFLGKIRIAFFPAAVLVCLLPRSTIQKASRSTPMDPLENVIWQALTTRQAHFAESSGSARRFLREVTALCGFERPDDNGYGSLARLTGIGGTAAIFLDHSYVRRPGWEYVAGAPLLRMVCENDSARAAEKTQCPQFVELGDSDSFEMLELTALTKPGPFGTRTHELGYYLGIRDEGKLVAMAGERLKVTGYTEVSAVCTHTEHLGKGYAGRLMSEIIDRIRGRGEKPFLHVRADNARAIALYQRLGFQTRWSGHFAVLRRTD